MVLVLLALAVRLIDVQVLDSHRYQTQATKELTVHVTVPAQRGGIFDRNGRVLAMSVPTDDVYVDDFLVKHPAQEARALSPILGIPAVQLEPKLRQRSGYVALAKQIPPAQARRITADAFPGVTVISDAKRSLPNGSLAAPVLGITNAAGAGAAGVEYQYNHTLAGLAGSETVLESPSGVALPTTPESFHRSHPGTGIELTLDEPLQFATEQALAGEIEASHALSGTAVIMDVHSGQILAMANLVADSTPSTGAAGSSAPPVTSVSEAPSNLALTQLYEPGSVFKLVTFSAALQDGLINPNSQFNVPDQITLDGSVFHDAEPHATEQLSATQILAQSSNIGTSEIAVGLGEQRLLGQVKNLGFGSPTGLGFPGESAGLLATAQQWEPTDLVSLPIGQVDAVTAQQVLDAYNTVADGGVFVSPRLVRGTQAPDGVMRTAPATASHRVLTPATDAELNSMLQQVVAQGTGTSAIIPGYTVAGKTGTAQIPSPGQDSYIPGAYMASFVGYAPATHPVFSAIVVLNRPTPIFGGTVAAPVFSQIMGYALHEYDIPTTPGASAQAPPAAGGGDAAQAQDIT